MFSNANDVLMNKERISEKFDNGVRYKSLFDEYIDKNTHWDFLKALQSSDRIVQITHEYFINKFIDHFKKDQWDYLDFEEINNDHLKTVIGKFKEDILGCYTIDTRNGDVISCEFYQNPYCDLTPIKYNWREDEKCVS